MNNARAERTGKDEAYRTNYKEYWGLKYKRNKLILDNSMEIWENSIKSLGIKWWIKRIIFVETEMNIALIMLEKLEN